MSDHCWVERSDGAWAAGVILDARAGADTVVALEETDEILHVPPESVYPREPPQSMTITAPTDDEGVPDWLITAAADVGLSTSSPAAPGKASQQRTTEMDKENVPTTPSRRALHAESEVVRLRSELKLLREDSRRQLDDSQTQLAECRRQLAQSAGRVKSGGAEGLAAIDAKMREMESAMEADVERQRLEAELASAKDAASQASRRLVRQERIVAKLMTELREEKARNEATSGARETLERLSEEVLPRVSETAARVKGLREAAARDLAAAAERVATAVLTDEVQAAQVAAEMEAARAAARMAEIAALEACERSEARAVALEERVVAQARLVTALILKGHTQPPSGAIAEVASDADADGVQVQAEAEAWAARLLGAVEQMTVRGAAAKEGSEGWAQVESRVDSGEEDTRDIDGGGEGEGDASFAHGHSPGYAGEAADEGVGGAHYVRLLEDELSGTISELRRQCELSGALEHQLHADRSMHAAACTDEHAAALAAAEAAADALLVGDGGGGLAATGEPRGYAPHGAAGGAGGAAEMRTRAAAAALLEELRLEGAKSARLEKIISKLMVELRAAKLHAAARGSGRVAIGTFHAIGGRLETALRENVAAVESLDANLRDRLDVAGERLAALTGLLKQA